MSPPRYRGRYNVVFVRCRFRSRITLRVRVRPSSDKAPAGWLEATTVVLRKFGRIWNAHTCECNGSHCNVANGRAYGRSN